MMTVTIITTHLASELAQHVEELFALSLVVGIHELLLGDLVVTVGVNRCEELEKLGLTHI